MRGTAGGGSDDTRFDEGDSNYQSWAFDMGVELANFREDLSPYEGLTCLGATTAEGWASATSIPDATGAADCRDKYVEDEGTYVNSM